MARKRASLSPPPLHQLPSYPRKRSGTRSQTEISLEWPRVPWSPTLTFHSRSLTFLENRITGVLQTHPPWGTTTCSTLPVSTEHVARGLPGHCIQNAYRSEPPQGLFLNSQSKGIALTCLLDKEQPLPFFSKAANESMSRRAAGR